MKMKRIATAVAGVVIGAFTLAACTPPEVTPPTTQPPAQGGDANGAGTTTPGLVTQSISAGWTEPLTGVNTLAPGGNSTHNANILYLTNGPGFNYFDDQLNTVMNTDFGTYELVNETPNSLSARYCIADGVTWSDGTPVDAADLILFWAAQNDRFDTMSEANFTPPNEDTAQTRDQIFELFQQAVASAGGNESDILDGGDTGLTPTSPGMTSASSFPVISNGGSCVTITYDDVRSDWFFQFGVSDVAAHVVARRALGIDDPMAAKQALISAFGGPDNYREATGTETPTVETLWNFQRNVEGAGPDATVTEFVPLPVTTFTAPNREEIAQIANVFVNDFFFTTLPADPGLFLSMGPYRIAEIVENQFVRLERNPYFNWAGNIFTRPAPDEVIVRWNNDPLALVQALQNGEVDIVEPDSSLDVLQILQGINGIQYETREAALYEHITLAMTNGGPFDPAHWGGNEDTARAVRLAFLATIPREQIVEVLIQPVNPNATVRQSFSQIPGSAGYDFVTASNDGPEINRQDLDRARQILVEAGLEGQLPIDVRLLYGPTPRREQQFELIRAAAPDLFNVINGVDANWGQLLRGGANGTLSVADAALFAWNSTSTALNNVEATFITGGINNIGGFSNARVDEIWDQIQRETNEQAALAMVPEFEQILFEEGFGAPIFQWPSISAWRDNIEGVHPSAIAPGIFSQFWDWSVAAQQ